MTSETTVVSTTYGPVRGVDNGRVIAWKGIRYAAAPVGELRWRSPVPPTPWASVVDAAEFGPACPQPTEPALPLDLGSPQGDDCLSVNVWAPSGTDPGAGKPVMVWVHGGAYIFGAASQPLYAGENLAANSDVVVVTVNYRLGAFGFLDLTSLAHGPHRFESNVALRDVLCALRWVRDNIGGFGGSAERITLFGESAGGGIVTTLLAMPEAAGLFSAAIAQSSPATSVYDATRAARVAEHLLSELGLGPDEIDRIRDVPTSAIVGASKRVFEAVPRRTPGTLAFAPTVDGDLVPDYPVKLARQGRSHPVPLIIGTNEHEAALFKWMKSPLMPVTPPAIRAMFAEIAAEQPALRLPTEEEIGLAYSDRKVKARGMGVASDIAFRMPSVWFAEGHTSVAPVYLYRFDWATTVLKLLRFGATHATELPYVWGNLVQGPKDFTFKLGGLKTGREVSARMQTRWTSFAKDGQPAGLPGEPDWLPYDESDRTCLVIDRQDRLAHDIDGEVRTLWGSQVLSFR